jgi:myo-inositol-1(or 4)-monophosphatase
MRTKRTTPGASGRTKHAVNLEAALAAAEAAARKTGSLMRRHLHSKKKANEATQHDIKLELDVRCQQLIERALRQALPQAALLGEEGVAGDPAADWRWVVDPIDGTVNFAYTIPHACVSIALQRRAPKSASSTYADGFQTVVGVVYDPFCDEMWTAIRGQPARLNGRVIRVSRRKDLAECIVSIGFAKSAKNLEATLPYFVQLVHQVRKIRMMGAAALALTYVATGRFDAYIERGIRLWDIAAGGLILECAGGVFWREAIEGQHAYRMVASNRAVKGSLKTPE